VQWIKDNGFGGIMVWALDLDDFRGSCGGEKFPLMVAIGQELGENVIPNNFTSSNDAIKNGATKAQSLLERQPAANNLMLLPLFTIVFNFLSARFK